MESSLRQNFDYFLVVDFEATCDEPIQLKRQEIEFPVLMVDSKDISVVKSFHEYVRPEMNPVLTDYCIRLTGIQQEMVDSSEPFPSVFERFKSWLEKEADLVNSRLEPKKKIAFVTVGNWDFSVALSDECRHHRIPYPKAMKNWINLKASFQKMTGRKPKDFVDMLQEFDIKPVGQLHSGIDDCHNTVSIIRTMVQKGFLFKITNSAQL